MPKRKKRIKRFKSSPAKTAKAIATVFEFLNLKEQDKSIIAKLLKLSDDNHLDNLMTPDDTAKILACSIKKLANDRVAGNAGLPHVKIGSRVYYKQADIAAYIERNIRVSTSDLGGAK